MKPREKQNCNLDLFRSRLDQILDINHPLYSLANQINRSYFKNELGSIYVDRKGRPGTPIRLMVGLNYLKHTFNESDESVVDRFVENPYWSRLVGMVMNIFNIIYR